MTIEERLYALLVTGGVIARMAEVTAVQNTALPYSTFFAVAQNPMATQQEALVQGLREWDFQFSSFAESPLLARAETKKIVDYLTSFHDTGIRVCFLKSRHVAMWDDDTKLAHSMAELTIWEALG